MEDMLWKLLEEWRANAAQDKKDALTCTTLQGRNLCQSHAAIWQVCAAQLERALDHDVDSLVTDMGGHNIQLKRMWSTDPWTATYEHGHVSYIGRGPTPEQAIVEARVDHRICNHYYSADFDARALTLEQMNEIRQGEYMACLGYPPEGEYQGGYRKETA